MNTARVSDHIARLMDETAQIGNRPRWLPFLQAGLVICAAVLVRYLAK
jgi:hypothetical protein